MQDHDRRSIASRDSRSMASQKMAGHCAVSMPAAALLSLAMNLPNLYSSTATVLVEQQQIPKAS